MTSLAGSLSFGISLLRKVLSIPVLFVFALYLTPISSAHFCHWFTEGEHHGSCGHHETHPSGSFKTPHDNDCLDFEKPTAQTLSNSPDLPVKQPDTPTPAIVFKDLSLRTFTEVELRLPVRSDTTDPPDQDSDPTRGPPFLMA
jgi:hypothetical protein